MNIIMLDIFCLFNLVNKTRLVISKFKTSSFEPWLSGVGTDFSVPCGTGSVTRLGDFWKFLATNVLIKVAQNDWLFFGLFWKRLILVSTGVTYFGNFYKHLGFFCAITSCHTGPTSNDCPIHCNSCTLDLLRFIFVIFYFFLNRMNSCSRDSVRIPRHSKMKKHSVKMIFNRSMDRWSQLFIRQTI